MLSPDRLFSPIPDQRRLARRLYDSVHELPIVSPHGHVDPALFSDPQASFGDPVELFLRRDHYVYRMLYSQGIPLEQLGIPARDGRQVEEDPRRIWQILADHFHLFRGTPSGLWLRHEMEEVFGVNQTLDGRNAQAVYDQIADCLDRPEFRPRALFERFRIRTLCTTDAAGDPLEAHRCLRASSWRADIRPTFRPDTAMDICSPLWREALHQLEQASGVQVTSCASFVRALETRRAYFKELGAVASDQASESALAAELEPGEVEAIFQHALRGQAAPDEAARFSAHMLMESARMSIEDGLVMQLHVGVRRNHHEALFQAYGPDRGADIPLPVDFTRGLQSLLNRYGSQPGYRLILFCLDESAYGRELAPLAGHYPAVRLGPPWWFFDSPNGMRRYFDLVMETAGLANTAGFNDDTRAFCSIPARHDVWRRAGSDWLAGLTLRGLVEEEQAFEMASELALDLACRAYGLGDSEPAV